MLLLLACTGTGSSDPQPSDYTSTTGPDHCGTITADETWAADLNPHTTSCHVSIEAGTVTIAPGTEVIVGGIKYVSVSAEGGLVVIGTAADPVRMAGETGERGTWNGLSFEEGARGELAHLSIEDAGYVAYPTIPYVSLTVRGTEITVEDVLITNGLDHGFAVLEDGGFSNESHGLVSTGNGRPGYGEADVVGSVVMEGLDLTGNDSDLLVVQGATIEGEAVWDDPGVPYAVGSGAHVDGTEEAPAHLTIGPGVEVQFDAGAGLSAGAYGPGSIAIEGTPESPVLLTGAGNDGSTYWEGLRLADGADDASCVFENVEIAYGGNGYWTYGNLHLENASPTVSGAFLHDSAAYGIYCQGECAPVLQDVTYANNPDGDTNL